MRWHAACQDTREYAQLLSRTYVEEVGRDYSVGGCSCADGQAGDGIAYVNRCGMAGSFEGVGAVG